MTIPAAVKLMLRPGLRSIRRICNIKADRGVDEWLSLEPGGAMRAFVEQFRWPKCPERIEVTPGAPVSVVIHLHFPELWAEFAAALSMLPGPFDLIVTVTENGASIVDDVKCRFPGATSVLVENRGRDFGPFMRILHDGYLDRADCVLKLHGKQSNHLTISSGTGNLWRRGAILSLTSSAEVVIGRFRSDPRLGIVGPGAFLMPNHRATEEEAWDVTRATTEAFFLSRGLALPKIEFFAGSMFWLSRSAIGCIRALDVRQSDFQDESRYTEQSLGHVMERAFIPILRDAGLRVGTV